MSDVSRRLWKFILEGLAVVALAIPMLEWLQRFSVLSLDSRFFLFYFAAFFLAAMVLTATGHESLIFRLLPAIPIAVLVISRDLALFINSLGALLIYAALHFLRRAPFWKWAAAGLLVLLLTLWLPDETMPGYVAVCLILIFATVLSEFLNRQSGYWILLFALVMGIALFIPSSEEPMRWERTRAFLSRVGNFFETTYKDVSYFLEGIFGGEDVAYTGYSEAGRLNGGTSGSDREALLFESNGKGHPVYLRGAEYAKMDPKGFLEKDETELPVNAWFAMYLSALSKSDFWKAQVLCFSKVERATITFQYLRTSDLIIPATTFNIDKGLEHGLPERKKKGFTYDINYIAFDTVNPYYLEMAENPALSESTATYSEACAVAKEVYGLDLSAYMSEEAYEESLRAYAAISTSPEYLDISMGTERTKQLAAKITEGCTSDMEKALRIEAYLRQYTYDTSTDLRDYDNYVEAFLFDVQKGYCVHYASAMVLLLRECGIPARFVQGFLYGKDSEGVVVEGDAHAWPEAYIEGLGWINFEPTAVMANAEETQWGLRTYEGGIATVVPENKKQQEQQQVETPTPPVLPESTPAAKEKTAGNVFLTIGIYLLSVIGIAGLLLLLTLMIRRIRYARLSPERRLKEDLGTVCRYLDRDLPEGTKAASVFEYLPYIKDETLRSELDRLFRGYYRVRFRGDAVEEPLAESMREMAGRIRRYKFREPVAES